MARRRGEHGYDRYLLDGERVVVALHRHWSMVAAPVGGWVAGAVFALWVDVVTPPGARALSTAVWWLWLGLTLWALWQVVDWRREWFVATDKRLLLTRGLITRNVAMMPLTKVTDLSYVRTLPGRLVGYGMFVLESAGQDQALREVTWIPHPDATYRAICAEIFGSPDDDALPVVDGPDGSGSDDEWPQEWLAPGEPDEPPVTTPARPRSPVVEHGDHSRAMPVSPPLRVDPSYDASHELYEPWPSDPSGAPSPLLDPGAPYGDDDEGDPRRPGRDTGPIRRWDD